MAHRGEILEKYLRKKKTNLVKLSQSLPWTTKTIYRDFLMEDLSLEKILEYSHALKYDFKEEFPELEALRRTAREPWPAYKPPEEGDDREGYYRNKYEDLLEKYTTTLESYNQLLLNKQNGTSVSDTPQERRY